MTYFDQAGCVKRLQLLDDSYDNLPGVLVHQGER